MAVIKWKWAWQGGDGFCYMGMRVVRCGRVWRNEKRCGLVGTGVDNSERVWLSKKDCAQVGILFLMGMVVALQGCLRLYRRGVVKWNGYGCIGKDVPM
jgi:hypothetical protein